MGFDTHMSKSAAAARESFDYRRDEFYRILVASSYDFPFRSKQLHYPSIDGSI
jgi:hypothetical protein